MDPREVIARQPMGRLQVVIVVLCIALNAVDGFDVLAISFAAPGIAAEWGIDRATLGVVLSMELLGMAAGSVLIGHLADRIGRRPVILGCLAVMATGMFLAASADSVAMLSATRLFTGLGIGGMLSSTSAMVAEFSNDRRRSLNVVLNIAGYSAGAIIGGMIASTLLARTGEWRSVFLVGAGATTLLLPLALLFMPESIDSQIARRPPGALDKLNRNLHRLGLRPMERLPDLPEREVGPSILALFSPGYATTTVLLTIAYFAQIVAFYYIQKWTPKIVVDMGFDAASAGRVLVCANIGCLLGAVAVGLASQRFRLWPLVVGAMLVSFVMITAYGLAPRELFWLSAVAALAGFFTNAGVVGMRIFPTRQDVFFFAPAAGDTRFDAAHLPAWVDVSSKDYHYGFPDIETRGFKIALDAHGPRFDPDMGERRITDRALSDVRAYLARRFPDLAARPLAESRVCQYENTDNGDLLIDRHPGWDNAWIVGGGSGHGFKHGPAVGRYVAGLALGAGRAELRFALSSHRSVPEPDVAISTEERSTE